MTLDLVALVALGGLLVVWAGYPALIGLVASVLPRRPRVAQDVAPRVTAVLATREDAPTVVGRVLNLFETAYPTEALNVVVASDGATEDLAAALTQFGPRVKVVQADAPGGKATALNAALRDADGDIVVFADSHQRFLANTIPDLVAAFGDARVGAVSGRLHLPAGDSSLISRYWAFERWLRNAEARIHSCVGVTGAVYAMRRSLWKPLPNDLLLDDVYTPMRLVLAGWRIAFEKSAVAVETRRPSPAQEYRRKVRTLTGVLQLCAWLPSVLVPVRNPIWFQFTMHKLLRLLTPYLVLLLAVWLAARGIPMLGPAAPFAVILPVIVILWAARARAGFGLRLKHAATEAAFLQLAALVAGFKGLRGRWQVWHG